MKVLVLSNMSPKPSAPLLGLFVDNQVKRLQDIGIDITYFKMRWNGDSLVHKLFRYPVFMLDFLFRVLLTQKKFDILHVHYYFPTIILAAIYKLLGNRKAKIVVTCHGSDIYLYEPPNYLYRKLSFLVDKWIFTSQELAERFYRPVANSEILCAGYEDSLFHRQSSELSEAKRFDCLMICHLNYNKGIDRFLKLASAMPDRQFALVGEGPLRNEVEIAAGNMENLTFFGNRNPEQLCSLIRESSLLLSLSRNESFGLTISEAQACGVPAIATVTDGSQAQIEDNGRLVEQSGEDEKVIGDLIERINWHLNLSAQEYRKMSLDVSEQVCRFSLTNVTAKIVAFYHTLADRE